MFTALGASTYYITTTKSDVFTWQLKEGSSLYLSLSINLASVHS